MDFQELSKLTAILAKQARGWHFHMLAKDCAYNKKKGKFALIVEDEGTGKSGISYFDEMPLYESRRLAEMTYGENFLAAEGGKTSENQNFLFMLDLAKKLDKAKKAWHHHHFSTVCKYNLHKGKHCIVLEDEGTGKIYTAVYDKKPMEDLVKLEKLFYKA